MNEEALNDVFTLSLNAGYTKDLEAFKELMANNEEARADAFSLAVEAGYTKDINAFSELMGAEPGKANVQSVGAAVDGNQAPQDGLSELEKSGLAEFEKKHPEEAATYINIQNISNTYADEIAEARAGISPDVKPVYKKESSGIGTRMNTKTSKGVWKDTYDYDNFTKQAIKQFAANNNKEIADVTREEYAPIAIGMAQDAAEKIVTDNATETYLKDLADKYPGFSDAAKESVVALQNFTKGIKEDSQKKFDQGVAEIATSGQALAVHNEQLANLKTTIEDEDQPMESRLAAQEEHKEIAEVYNSLARVHNTRLDEIGKIAEDATDPQGIVDLVGRSYQLSEVIFARVKDAGTSIVAGAINLIDDAATLSSSLPGLPGSVLAWEVDMNTTSSLESAADYLTKMGESYTDSVRLKRSFSGEKGVYNSDTFGDALLDLFSEQSVNLALLASTGGAGLYVMAGSATGEKFADMENDWQEHGIKVSPLEYYASGLLYGAAEYATERVTLGNLRMFKNGAASLIKTGSGDVLSTAASRWAVGGAGAKAYGVSIASEGAAEGAATLIQNFTDKYILDKDVYLFNGVKESAISGAAMSAFGFGIPGVIKTAKDTFATPSEVFQANKNSLAIEANEKRRLEIVNDITLKNTSSGRAEVKALNKNSYDLAMQNLSLKGAMEARLDGLSNIHKRRLLNIGKNQFDVRREIEEAIAGDLPPLMKAEAIKTLGVKLTELESAKASILHATLYESDAEHMAANLASMKAEGVDVTHVDVNEAKDIAPALKAAINESSLSKEQKADALNKVAGLILKGEVNTANGFDLSTAIGLPVIVTVKNNAITNNGAVMSHELFHATIEAALIEGGADITKLATELRKFAVARFKGAKAHFEAVDRAYKAKGADMTSREILTNFSDYIRTNDVSSDLTLQGKILNLFGGVLKANPEVKTIKTGKDVFDFMMEYGGRFESGNVGSMLTRIKSGDLTVDTSLQGVAESKEDVALSKDLSNEIQAVYDNQGVGAAFEISEMYRGMATKKAAKYRDVPGYATNKDLLVDEILTGKRGVVDMVMKYNPDSGVPISAYINKYLDARSIEAAQRVLDTEFTSDVTEAKDVVASEAAEIAETDAPKVSSRLRRQIKLEETEMNIVRRAATRALMTAPPIKAASLGKPQAFKDSLLKTYNTLLFKMVKNHMGTGDMYRMFVKQSYPVFNELMPLSFLLNGKMSIFYKPDINESGEQKRMTIGEANLSGIPLDKAGAGPLKWQRISPTPAEFYDWAMGKGMAANTKPARKTTMARLIARKIGIDATMEVLQNPVQQEYNETGAPIEGKTVNVMEVVGIVNINDMAESAVVGTISAAIDVHPDLKFSKNLNPEEKDLLEKALDSANPSLEEIQLVESAIKGKRQGLKKHSREAKQTVRVVALAIGTKGITFDEAMTLPMVQHFFNAAVAKDKHKFQESILRAEVENVVPTTMFGSPISLLRWDNGNSENKSRVTKMINGLHSFLITKDYTAEKAAEIIVQLFVGPYAMKGPNVGYKSVKGFYEAFPFLAEVGYTLDKNTYEVKKGKNKGKTRTDYYLRKGGKPATPKKVRLLRSAIMAFSNGQYNQKIDNFQAEAEQSKKDVLELADILIAMYNDLGHNLDVATIISALNGATNSLLRLAAPLHTKITEVESKGDVVIEHEIPVNKVAKAMGTAITTGDKSLLIDLLNEQGITLLDKVIDAKLKEAGLRDMIAPWGIAPVKVLNSNGVIKLVAARYKNVAEGTKIYTVEDARTSFSKNLNEEFNNILEESGSIPASKIISPTEAIKRGKKASRYLKNQGIMISAAEDFVGLMYKMLAKGKTGETQLEWLLDKLVIPYDVAVDNVSIARLLKSEQLRKISKSAKLKSMLKAEAFEGMTGEDAVRLYIWNLRGVAKGKFVKEAYVDMAVDYMSKNPELKAYADAVHAIAGAVAYAAPNARWAHGSIEMDLVGGINGELRALELEQSGWSLNVKEVFSEDNLNKLEALYGVNHVTALKNILQRMKSGRNRIDQETDKTSKKAQGWISNQVGAIMFLNMRSALLQGLSALNYINTTDHNPLQAIRRMLNVPQYAKDTKFLLGSAFMKDRRMGMRIDVNEEDVARASRDTGNVISRALKIALNKGFIPTRLMDTAAIVIGGAGFYRSRINTYVDSGMSIASAEKMAFADFRKATINSQQSSDPRMVSQQQASTMGRFVLQFGNTPGQYTRIQIKAVKDIINGRGDMKAHIGKILYYGMIQQALFTFAQQALWAALLDDDDKWITSEEGRGLVDGMLSSTLRGLGLYGAIIDTAMRTAKVWEKETSKGYMGSNEKVVIEALGISPSVKSIAKKTTNAMNISKYRGDDFGIDPYSLHSPEVEQAAWLLEGTVNIPSKRILDKMHHIESIMSGQNEAWQNIALFFGFQEWQVGTGESGKKAKQRKLENKGLSGPVKKEKKIKKSISDMTDAEFKAWRIKNPAK